MSDPDLNPITVEHIDTQPMTSREYTDAVTALTVLITEWSATRTHQ